MGFIACLQKNEKRCKSKSLTTNHDQALFKCLNFYLSDQISLKWLKLNQVKRLKIIEDIKISLSSSR